MTLSPDEEKKKSDLVKQFGEDSADYVPMDKNQLVTIFQQKPAFPHGLRQHSQSAWPARFIRFAGRMDDSQGGLELLNKWASL